MKRSYKTTLVGIAAVSVAFIVAIPLGFELRERYPASSDNQIAVVVVTALLVVSVGLMRLLNGPFTRPSTTGYEVTFNDFERLMSEPSTQPKITALLRAWYGDEVSSNRITLRDLHARIQSDPAKQYAIYQEAMNAWR